MSTGKIAKSMLNVASDFYNGAVKGIPKANQTVNNAISKLPNSVKNYNDSLQVFKNTSTRILKDKNMNSSTIVKGITPLNRNYSDNTVTKVLDSKNIIRNANNIKGKGNLASSTGNFFGEGIRNSIKSYNKDNKIGLIGAIEKGHSKYDSNLGKTRLSKAKMAGTFATVGVAGRVASGGGLYRDRYGNVNLPGVPFI